MKVSGKTIRLMVMENICIQTVLSMKATGKKTNNTGKEKKRGLMEPVIKEIMLKVRKMELANSDGQTDQLMKDSS